MPHALFPGTFDPPTLGHVDLVRRARGLFERVTVALAQHPTKQALLSIEERIELLRRSLEGLPDVEVVRLRGLVVRACEQWGCRVIVRGVRSGSDLDYETRMAWTNQSLYPEVDTVLLPATPAVAHITSTLVRQIARMGGDTTPLVPPPVAEALKGRFPEG